MTVIPLAADAAQDLTLVSRLTDLINTAYTIAESDLWSKEMPRTNMDETHHAITELQVATAYVGNQLVGAIRSHRLDETTWTFGALAVAPDASGQGIGRALVSHVETRAQTEGAQTMQLEVLAPREPLPYLTRLAGWYQRLKYQEVSRKDLAEVFPADAPFLTCPCDVVVMRKALSSI
ncbi:MAG: GNAT family N-acetyltransferase [Actinomycetia bacterium]|nr:GNAT family N-acetyltransferase [Actinomycetes bacterium]